jgi:hypothetical protein
MIWNISRFEAIQPTNSQPGATITFSSISRTGFHVSWDNASMERLLAKQGGTLDPRFITVRAGPGTMPGTVQPSSNSTQEM